MVENQDTKDYGALLITYEKQRKIDIQREGKGAQVKVASSVVLFLLLFFMSFALCLWLPPPNEDEESIFFILLPPLSYFQSLPARVFRLQWAEFLLCLC